MTPRPTRRQTLQTAGATLVTALAGCLGDGVDRTVTLQPIGGEQGDAFGWDVALGEQWALVGAPAAGADRAGAAYLFDMDNAQQRLEPDRPTGEFGVAVALDGETALVGASATADADTDGAVTVFRRSDGEWVREARLVPPDRAASGDFGYDVSLANERALVGARGTDRADLTDTGVAHVYERADGEWTHTTTLALTDSGAYDYTGGSVALADDRALLGSFLADAPATDSGSATVFEHSDGAWNEGATLTAPDGQSGDRFGNAVALDGATALVGAVGRGGDPEAPADSGGAYIFRADDDWSHRTTLSPPEDDPDAAFGVAVALDGQRALVGAFEANGIGPGRAVLFERNGSGWTRRTTLRLKNGDAGDGFGSSVALYGDRALVGAVADGPGSATRFEL